MMALVIVSIVVVAGLGAYFLTSPAPQGGVGPGEGGGGEEENQAVGPEEENQPSGLPQGNENIEFRGAVCDGIGGGEPWPGREIPDSENYLGEQLDYAKSLGVNYISVWANYKFDLNTYEIFENHDKEKLSKIIEMAHERGLKVVLFSFAEKWEGHEVEGEEFEGVDDTQAFLDNLTSICREWAEFAENHDVEIYALLQKPEEFLRVGEDPHGVNTVEALDSWYENMLSEVRQIYSGDVGAIPSWRYNCVGYDYIFIEYCGVPEGTPLDEQAQVSVESGGEVTIWTGPRDFNHYRGLLENFIPVAKERKENAGAKGVIINGGGMDAIDNFAYHPRTEADENAELERAWFDNVAHALDIMLEEIEGQMAGINFISVFEEQPSIENVLKSHYLV